MTNIQKMEKIDDEMILYCMLNTSGMTLESASDRLKDDFNIVLSAVRLDGNALCYASKRLQDNEKIVKASFFSSNYKSLRYASPRLQEKFILETRAA